jgi:uncharacterized Zn finger protein
MALTRWLMEADDGSLSRGRTYARQGRARIVKRSDSEVTAVVAGTTSYDVSVSDRHAFCTCPVGATGAVCKHVVAVVLTADSDEGHGPRPDSGSLTEASTPDPKRGSRPRTATPLSTEEARALVDSLRTRAHLDYYRAMDHGARAYAVADRLDAALTADNADALRPILERAVTTLITMILRSDDSSGVQGQATDRFLDVHAAACRLGSPEPAKLARWLGSITFGDDGFFALDPIEYADALGERGLAAYRAQAERRLIADPGDYHATWVLRRLTVQSRDVEKIVEQVGGQLDSAHRYGELVDALLEIGATDVALQYAQEGAALSGPAHQTSTLVDTAVDLLAATGQWSEAVALRRDHLDRHPTLTAFSTLRRTASAAGTWSTERLQALDVLASRNPEDWLRALLLDGDTGLAWEASTTMEIGTHMRLELLRARSRTAPSDVFEGYVQVVDATLVEARPENYREGVKLLGELRRACQTGGRVPEYDEYVAELLEHHRRRPTLVRLLRAMPPAERRAAGT